MIASEEDFCVSWESIRQLDSSKSRVQSCQLLGKLFLTSATWNSHGGRRGRMESKEVCRILNSCLENGHEEKTVRLLATLALRQLSDESADAARPASHPTVDWPLFIHSICQSLQEKTVPLENEAADMTSLEILVSSCERNDWILMTIVAMIAANALLHVGLLQLNYEQEDAYRRSLPTADVNAKSLAAEILAVHNIVKEESSLDAELNPAVFAQIRLWLSAMRYLEVGKSDEITESFLRYTLRVLEQCERRHKVADDAVVAKCERESVGLLGALCRDDAEKLPLVFPAIKRVHARLASSATDSKQLTSLLSVLQFFLDHAEVMVYDPVPALDQYFLELLGSRYQDSAAAIATVKFVCDNLGALSNNDVMANCAPNLLKLLAWHPQKFVEEFHDILGAVLSPRTSLEILHTILDLPCLAAALDLREKVRSRDTYQQGQLPATVQAFLEPNNRGLFNFVLRSRAGQGDTCSNLGHLHSLLSDSKSTAAVQKCMPVVPILLSHCLRQVCRHAKSELLARTLTFLLDRHTSIFGTSSHVSSLQSVMSEELVRLLGSCPSLVISEEQLLLEHVVAFGADKEAESGGGSTLLHTQLMWAVGEYCSPVHVETVPVETVRRYHETLETLSYEFCRPLGQQLDSDAARTLSILMSALAKLACREQELIARTVLCITKMSGQIQQKQFKQQEGQLLSDAGQDAVKSRAAELLAILRMPNIADTILNAADTRMSGDWHRDSTALPTILRTITNN